MKRALIPALALLGLLGLVVRFVELDSNPPRWLSRSAALYIDEGYKLHSARNQILFGAPTWTELDEYDGGSGKHSVFRAAVVPILRNFGVRLQPVRVFVALLGSVSILGLGGLIGLRFGWRWGVGAASFLSLDFVHLIFSRRALLEVPQALWAVVMLGCLLGRGPTWFRAGLTMLGFALAYLTKASAMLWLGAIVPGFLLYLAGLRFRSLDSSQRNRRFAQLLLGGALAVSLAYILLYLMPHGLLEGVWGERTNVADPISILTENLLSTLSRFDPVLVGAGLVSSAYLLLRPLVAVTPPGWLMVGSWGLLGHLALMLLNYNPLRYHLYLIPVYICTTVIFAWDAGQMGLQRIWTSYPRWARRVLYMLFLYAGASVAGGLCYLLTLRLPIGTQPGLTPATSLFVGAVTMTLVAAVFLVMKRNPGIEAEGWRQWERIIASACLILASIVYLGELEAWWAHRSKTISQASHQVGRILPPDAIVAGPWAPMLCFETPVRTLYLIQNRNEATLAQIRPTHFLFVNTVEGEYLRDLFESGRMPGLNGITSLLEAPIDETREVILYSFRWDERRAHH